jgi:hypothetical protein
MRSNFPDCMTFNNLLVFGTGKNLYISKGWRLFPFPLEGASESFLGMYRVRMEQLLTSVGRSGFNLQIRRTFDSDFENELNTYNDLDQKKHEWSSLIRGQVFDAYSKSCAAGMLRREYCEIYLGKWTSPSEEIKSKRDLLNLLDGYKTLFENLEGEIRSRMDGSKVQAMTGKDYFESYFKAFNPTFASRFRHLVGHDKFIPALTMQENTMSGDIVEVGNGKTALMIDGKHTAILTINRWPSLTIPNISRALTKLPFNDYSITFNIWPCDVQEEAKKAATLASKLKKGQSTEEQLSVSALKKRELDLLSAALQPMYAAGSIVAWADTEAELMARCDAIQANIRAMSGADYWKENETVMARRAFEYSLPAWQGEKQSTRAIYAESPYMADLLPISAGVEGYLTEGQALLDNEDGGILGIAAFVGSQALHTFITGASRAGKSVSCIALLSQLAHNLGFICIVESGNSWGTIVKAMGGQQIIVKSDGKMTINYFDTAGLPLLPSQIDFCVSAVMGMCKTEEADKLSFRKGLVEKCISTLYKDRFETWSKENHHKYAVLRRFYVALKTFGEKNEGWDNLAELLEMWKQFAIESPEAKANLLEQVTEEEMVDAEKTHQSAKEIMCLAHVFYEPGDYPQHSSLAELCETGGGLQHEHERQELVNIGRALAAWRRGGSFGCLFDGPNNVDFGANVVQFELGEIPDSSVDLKRMVGFILTNRIRSEVVKRSRAEKKLFIYEEASIILNLPGGAELFSESLAQMAKYSCAVWIITQQLAQFMDNPKVAAVALGNCRQFLILRNSIDDLQKLSENIGLPPIMAHRASLFKVPSQMPAHNRYASMVYYNPSADVCAIGRLYASPEVIYVADSEGENYMKRMQELKNSTNIIESIKHHARR